MSQHVHQQQQLQREQQKSSSNWGEAFIETFVVGFVVMLLKAIWWLLLHPMIWVPLSLISGFVYLVGPYGSIVVVVIFVFLLHCWWVLDHKSFSRRLGTPMHDWWIKFWRYEIKGQWKATMMDCGLMKNVRMRPDRVPKIICVQSNQWRDRVQVKLVKGQVVEQLEKATRSLQHSFEALDVRVIYEGGLKATLVFRYSDPLVETIRALPIKEGADLRAVQVGLTDEGERWTIPLVHQQGAHMLIAATTGGGKSGVPWSLIRGVSPYIRDGLVRVCVADPKGGVEFKRGRKMWDRYADDYTSILEMLKELVEEMDARGRRQADASRLHEPSVDEPIFLIIIDEILSITALESSTRKVAIQALLGKLLTKGRSLGFVVIGCSQDATKAMLALRQFFQIRWAGRLLESNQVDMVLGEGARDQGARCDDNLVVPHTLPGVGFVRIDGVREPVRVRSAYVTDEDIDWMVENYSPQRDEIEQKKIEAEVKVREISTGSIQHTPETIAEVEAIMRFYEKQVSIDEGEPTIEDIIEHDESLQKGSTEEFEALA